MNNNHQKHYSSNNNDETKLMKNSVHWNEEVHELLIIDHDEYDYIDNDILENDDDNRSSHSIDAACCSWLFCK